MQEYAAILSQIRTWHKRFHGKLTEAANRELSSLVSRLEGLIGKMALEKDRLTLQDHLKAVGRAKGWYPEMLQGKQLDWYFSLGWEKGEVASLYNLVKGQFLNKLRILADYRAKQAEENRFDPAKIEEQFSIPQYILEKSADEITEEDAALMARLQLMKASVKGDIAATKAILENFQKFATSDLKVKWEQVKVLENFLMSHFLPSIQKRWRVADPLTKILDLCERELMEPALKAKLQEVCKQGRIDPNAIFRDTLKEIAPEIRDVAARALDARLTKTPAPNLTAPQPEFDKAVEKAKIRGKKPVPFAGGRKTKGLYKLPKEMLKPKPEVQEADRVKW